ncbi:hypothetical protein C8R45DRAFT_956616 [Mycena sanguinolenta]|nr:hypothetical protein C8R45DRAFT_956616 [Mycena sanguinolenta]
MSFLIWIASPLCTTGGCASAPISNYLRRSNICGIFIHDRRRFSVTRKGSSLALVDGSSQRKRHRRRYLKINRPTFTSSCSDLRPPPFVRMR